jgi:hypothetical protein
MCQLKSSNALQEGAQFSSVLMKQEKGSDEDSLQGKVLYISFIEKEKSLLQ